MNIIFRFSNYNQWTTADETLKEFNLLFYEQNRNFNNTERLTLPFNEGRLSSSSEEVDKTNLYKLDKTKFLKIYQLIIFFGGLIVNVLIQPNTIFFRISEKEKKRNL